MIRNLLATTAVATLIASGAWAQSSTTTSPTMPQTQAAPEQPMVKKAEGELASNFIGESVYNGTSDDAENIGEVNDLVLNPDGTVKAVVIGVGGFLGIGQKDVAIEYDLVKWVDRENDRWLVVETTAEALKAQEEFDKAAYEPVPPDSDVAETEPATEEDLKQAESQQQAEQPADQQQAAQTDSSSTTTTTTATPPAADSEETAAAPAEEPAEESQDQAAAPAEEPAEESQDQAAAPAEEPADQAAAPAEEPAEPQEQAASSDQAQQSTTTTTTTAETPAAETDSTTTGAVDRSTLQEVQISEIGTEEFVGTTVYGANDETIGEIGEVVLTDDGKVDAVLIDVGGFLGIGEKPVAVAMDNLQFMADQDGNRYLYTAFTKEQLEAAPAYDEAQWAENRDEMRLAVPN